MSYTRTLTDAEWAEIEPLVKPQQTHAGVKQSVCRRAALDAMLWAKINGKSLRSIPPEAGVAWPAAYAIWRQQSAPCRHRLLGIVACRQSSL